jgi:hypothetical protein
MFEHNSNVHPDSTYHITCYILNIIHAAISILSGLLHSAKRITDYRDMIHSRVQDNCLQISQCKKHKYKWTFIKSIQININGWMSFQSNFLSMFTKLQKATISFIMFVHPSTWNNLVPIAQMLMKFVIWVFFKNLSPTLRASLKFDWVLYIKTNKHFWSYWPSPS